MIYFCSYFDFNYLSRFLTLLKSLEKFNVNYTFYVLALDKFVLNFLKDFNFKKIKLIRIDEVENEYKELLIVKKNRSKIEYYFTLTPFLPKYIHKKYFIKNISYLDADFYFLKDPYYKIQSNSNFSVVLIKQDSDPKYGLYNVGWIYFNFKFSETKKILEKWSGQCLNSCSDIPKNGLYADQKYLDEWPKILKNFNIEKPEESCLSPWDNNYKIENNLNKIFAFHFHGLELKKNYFVTGFSKYNKRISVKILNNIYKPYIKEISFIEKKNDLTSSSIRNKHQNNFKKLFLMFKKSKSYFKKKLYKDFYNY